MDSAVSYRLHMIGGPKDGFLIAWPEAPARVSTWISGEDALASETLEIRHIEYVRIGYSPDRNPMSVGYRFKP